MLLPYRNYQWPIETISKIDAFCNIEFCDEDGWFVPHSGCFFLCPPKRMRRRVLKEIPPRSKPQAITLARQEITFALYLHRTSFRRAVVRVNARRLSEHFPYPKSNFLVGTACSKERRGSKKLPSKWTGTIFRRSCKLDLDQSSLQAASISAFRFLRSAPAFSLESTVFL